MDLWAPSADRRETLPRDHYLLRLDNPGPKIGGPPLKTLRGKNMQNLDRFYTTSEFDREYLRNETRYKKSVRYVYMWVWTHSNWLFQETIFRPLGGAGPWNFLHSLDTGQGLLAHTLNQVGVPQKF